MSLKIKQDDTEKAQDWFYDHKYGWESLAWLSCALQNALAWKGQGGCCFIENLWVIIFLRNRLKESLQSCLHTTTHCGWLAPITSVQTIWDTGFAVSCTVLPWFSMNCDHSVKPIQSLIMVTSKSWGLQQEAPQVRLCSCRRTWACRCQTTPDPESLSFCVQSPQAIKGIMVPCYLDPSPLICWVLVEL